MSKNLLTNNKPARKTIKGICGGCPGCMQCGCPVNALREAVPTTCPFPESPCAWFCGPDMETRGEFPETTSGLRQWVTQFGITYTDEQWEKFMDER